jgi:hypothetical protein
MRDSQQKVSSTPYPFAYCKRHVIFKFSKQWTWELTALLVIRSYNLFDKNRCFGETCCPHGTVSGNEGTLFLWEFCNCLQNYTALSCLVVISMDGWGNQTTVCPFLESRFGSNIVWTEIVMSYIQCVVGGLAAWITAVIFWWTTLTTTALVYGKGNRPGNVARLGRS